MRHWFRAPPKDRIESAVRNMADRNGDVEYHRSLLRFYSEEMGSLDPYNSPEKAWAFAHAMQKYNDHTQDLRKAVELAAKAEAILAKLKA